MTATHTQLVPATMRAFAIDRFGEPGSIRELPLPEIVPDEMLIRVHTRLGLILSISKFAAGPKL